MKAGLKVFTGILREMRRALPKGTATEDPSYRHVIQQFRTYQLTPDKVCRDPKAAYHQASTYLCYLQSNRLNQELIQVFKGKGDRTIEESAGLVGLKLPKCPTDNT